MRLDPEADPAAIAPLLCAGVTVFNGMRKMEIPAGEIVAIQGLGGLGHLALQYANKMGYRVVVSGSYFSTTKGLTDISRHYPVVEQRRSLQESLEHTIILMEAKKTLLQP